MSLSLAARYGLHRVFDGDGTFPQPTWKLDSDPSRAVRPVFERRYAA